MSAPEDSDADGVDGSDEVGASDGTAGSDGAPGGPRAADPYPDTDVAGRTAAPSASLAVLDDACERLRIERRILTDERCAFEQFADRLVATEGAVSTATIESHYRETVMAVPHYHVEYGDAFQESVAAELGGTVATDLQRRERVEPPTVDAIRRAARRCRTRRDRVVDRIDAERHAVRAARDEIDAMRDALTAIGDDGPADAPAGPTVRSRCRLRRLLARCDEFAHRRREQLGLDAGGSTDVDGDADSEQRSATRSEGAAGSGGSGGLDTDPGSDCVATEPTMGGLQPGQLQSLCYGDLDTERPVLAALAALRRSIECRRRRSVSE